MVVVAARCPASPNLDPFHGIPEMLSALEQDHGHGADSSSGR